MSILRVQFTNLINFFAYLCVEFPTKKKGTIFDKKNKKKYV